ncbi:unnamed protein product [Rotaria magnacalcarata]
MNAGGATNDHDNGATFGIILLGNTGVGKSFLGNILLGREVFKHECSPSPVTHATEFQAYTADGDSYAVFNIPGLLEDDQDAVDRNKQEIYKAFQQSPNSVVGFVFTGGSGGRIKSEDLIAFNAIHKTYNFKQESLVIIINDLPSDRPKTYESETTIKLERLLKIPNVKVCFLNHINTRDAGECEELCKELVEFIIVQCEPHIHEKVADIQLNVDVISQLKEELRQQERKFKREIALLTTKIAEIQRKIEADKLRRDQEYKALLQNMAEEKLLHEAEKLHLKQLIEKLRTEKIADADRYQRSSHMVQQAHKMKKKFLELCCCGGSSSQ